MTVRVSDPFGLVELGRAFRTTVPLTVTPRTVPAPHDPARRRLDRLRRQPAAGVRDGQRRGRHGARVPPRRRPAPGPLAQLGPGRRADGAPRGAALAVAGDALPRQPACVAHRGQGIASSLEAAVSAAASIAVHLSQRGFTVRLVTAAGEDTASDWHIRDADLNTGPLLEALAVVQPLAHGPARHRLADRGRRRRAARRGARRASSSATSRCCAGCTRTAGSALAVALDVDAVALPPTPAGATRPRCSRQQGWRSVSLGPRDRLEAVWEELGRATRQLAVARRARRARRSRDADQAVDGSSRMPRRPCPPGPSAGRLGGRRRHHLGRAARLARVHRATPATTSGRCSSWRIVVAGRRRASAAGGGCPARCVVLAQVLLVGWSSARLVVGSPLPVGDAWTGCVDAFEDAVDSANRFAAPVPPTGAARRTRC